MRVYVPSISSTFIQSHKQYGTQDSNYEASGYVIFFIIKRLSGFKLRICLE
jgi:hypothetical protein